MVMMVAKCLPKKCAYKKRMTRGNEHRRRRVNEAIKRDFPVAFACECVSMILTLYVNYIQDELICLNYGRKWSPSVLCRFRPSDVEEVESSFMTRLDEESGFLRFHSLWRYLSKMCVFSVRMTVTKKEKNFQFNTEQMKQTGNQSTDQHAPCSDSG